MAIYKNKQSVLDASLGEWKARGFSLREPDDHFTDLYFKDKRIATFNQAMVTIEIVREGCQNYWNSLMRHTGILS